MDLINEIDRMPSPNDGDVGYVCGYDQALVDVRAKALAYVKQRQAMDMECSTLIHSLLEENAALARQAEEAQDKLLRATRMIVPGHRSLGDLVDILIDERDGAVQELDDHNCEDNCDNCSWGNDDCDECDNVAGTVKRAIEILEELT